MIGNLLIFWLRDDFGIIQGIKQKGRVIDKVLACAPTLGGKVNMIRGTVVDAYLVEYAGESSLLYTLVYPQDILEFIEIA